MKIHKDIEIRTRIEFTRTEILDALKRVRDIPPDATVHVHVPGGGDFSNMDLDLDDNETPLVVTFTTREERAR